MVGRREPDAARGWIANDQQMQEPLALLLQAELFAHSALVKEADDPNAQEHQAFPLQGSASPSPNTVLLLSGSVFESAGSSLEKKKKK
jgi:hypothetical protein